MYGEVPNSPTLQCYQEMETDKKTLEKLLAEHNLIIVILAINCVSCCASSKGSPPLHYAQRVSQALQGYPKEKKKEGETVSGTERI